MQTYFHLGAWFENVAAGVTDSQVNAVQDSILTITNNNFLLPARAQIKWVYGAGVGMDRLRLNVPPLRYVGLPSLVPINVTAAVPSPFNLVDLENRPVFVDPIDQVEIDTTNTDAGAQNHFVVAAFAFGRKEPAAGPVYRVRATAAITGSTGTWVNGSMTMDQSLPQGRYEVVGLDLTGTNLIAGRLVFPGASFRPGAIARNSASSLKHPYFDTNSMGSYGFFDFPNLPTLDIFVGGANTAQVIYMDLVRVSSSPGYAVASGLVPNGMAF